MGNLLGKTVWLLTGLCLILLLTPGVATVSAGSETIPGIWLTDPELDQIRGGYSGFYFGVYFSGYWDNLGNASGQLFFDGGIHELEATPELPAGGPVAELAGDGAVIQAYVGNFQGMNGAVQIVQAPGNFNVIQNNMLFQIAIINVTDESALPALQNALPFSW